MKKSSAALLCALTSSLCTSVMGADLDVVVTSPIVWTNADASVTQIRLTAQGQTVANNWSCTDPDSYLVRASLPQAVQNRIFAVLTAARLSNTPVTIRVDGCEAGRPAIIGARF